MFKWFKNKRDLKQLLAVASLAEQSLLSSSAGILRAQLEAIGNDLLKLHHYVHGDFARGYMDGFLSAAIEANGFEVDDEMHLLVFKMIGYSFFFSGDADKSKVFAAETLELLTHYVSADVVVGRNLGISEYKVLLESQSHPAGLYNGYAAQR